MRRLDPFIADGPETLELPLDLQLRRFQAWADEKLRNSIDHYIPAIKPHKVIEPPEVRRKENDITLKLFKQTFSSFIWTGIECSNPESTGGGGR